MTLHLASQILTVFYVTILNILGLYYTFKSDKLFEGSVLVALAAIYGNVAFGV
jgi:hypothetical protein